MISFFEFNENSVKFPCLVCKNVTREWKCEGCKYLQPMADLTLEIEQAVKKAVEEDA